MISDEDLMLYYYRELQSLRDPLHFRAVDRMP